MRRLLASLMSLLLLVSVLTAQTPGPPYRLQIGDSFQVMYRITPEYNQTVTIQPDGAVSLDLIGQVQVSGLTVAQAVERVRVRAGERLNDPEVSIELKDFDRPRFTVLGEVTNPGRYELRGPLTVEDGLALAGGFKITARHTNIILIHRVNDEIGETELINYKELEKPARHHVFVSLRPGDLIIVPQSNLSKVERFVRLANVGVYYPLPTF